ncbi:MAG: hypothetical protein ACYCS0_05810 [bacterium]
MRNEHKNKGKKDSQVTYAIVNSEIMTLSNFFNYCREKGYPNKNPCAGYPALKLYPTRISKNLLTETLTNLLKT